MNEQKVRELAYQKWEKAGYPQSDGVYFWVEAEKELTQKVAPKRVKAEPVSKAAEPVSKVAAKRAMRK